jgi:hypothetical protein
MCTVTVNRSAGDVLLTMNRDEQRSRAPEKPPRLVGRHGRLPAWIGPADGERGGTWIAANDHGVTACLLNAYAPQDLELFGREDVPSRGHIIPELMKHDPDGARDWLTERFDPSPYPSFTLVVVAPGSADVFAWRLDGGVAHSGLPEGWSVVTSSFWRTEEVVPWRQREFARWRQRGAACVHGLPSFNLLEVPGRLEWSPFMTRPISLTRSVTQVEVSRETHTLRMRYWRREAEKRLDPSHPTAVRYVPLVATETVS